MKNLFLSLALLMVISCTTSQENVNDTNIVGKIDISGSDNVHVYDIIYDKYTFRFEDKQNVIWRMKSITDSIMLSKTDIIYYDSLKESHLGDWIVPSQSMADTAYIQINGSDTVYFKRNVKVFPSNAFHLIRSYGKD